MQNKDIQNKDIQNKKVLLEIKHHAKKYGDLTPLQDVNCTVESAEVISVIGSSGTGKAPFSEASTACRFPTAGKCIFPEPL